jgi:hypothetical protein
MLERDLLDFAARNLAANRGAKKHTRQSHVIDVTGLSGYFIEALFARDRSSDDALTVHARLFIPLARPSVAEAVSLPRNAGHAADGIVYPTIPATFAWN